MKKIDSIFNLELSGKYESDTLTDRCSGLETQKDSNRILNYRRISNWENFFLASGILSVAKAVGSNIDNFHFFSAITGDMFSYLYAKNKPCDSGITNYFFIPAVVKKAYAAFGYDCIYLSNAQIKKEFRAVMNMIKTSVDNNIPILAWGMGNISFPNGSHYDPMPEGCLIGGYDKDDLLYVNLYPGSERLGKDAVDADGYTAIKNGLDTTNGLFFVGKQIAKTDLKEIYTDVIGSIPTLLSLPLACGYTFGKDAFYLWANTLLDDSHFENKSNEELSGICWDIHCSPYCMVCTSDAYNYLKMSVEQYPDLNIAVKILPLFEKIKQLKDNIWSLHGDFFPPMDKFRTHEFRAQIAGILKEMGNTCEMIINTFE